MLRYDELEPPEGYIIQRFPLTHAVAVNKDGHAIYWCHHENQWFDYDMCTPETAHEYEPFENYLIKCGVCGRILGGMTSSAAIMKNL